MDVELNEYIVEMLLGLLALGVTVMMEYVRSKKKEAYDQGDEILEGFAKYVEMFQRVALVFPVLEPLADEIAQNYANIHAAWNDPRVSTAEMKKLGEDMNELIAEAVKLLDSLKK